jgi:putative alpha-1,2-mannosidase
MIGNDDCGQMSAWYILSTLGFYPVNPANGEFVVGVPQVASASIRLSNNRTFNIKSDAFSESKRYRNQVYLNEEKLINPHITYDQIMRGGMLTFVMTK